MPEESGRIADIGRWVRDEACRQLARWRAQGLEPGVMTPEEFGAFIRKEVAQNIRIVKEAGIPIEG